MFSLHSSFLQFTERSSLFRTNSPFLFLRAWILGSSGSVTLLEFVVWGMGWRFGLYLLCELGRVFGNGLDDFGGLFLFKLGFLNLENRFISLIEVLYMKRK